MELVHLLSRGISTELWSCSWKWQKTFVSGPQDKIWFFVNLLFPVSRMWNSIMNQFRVVVQFKHTRKLKLHIWFLDYVCRAVSLQNCPKAEYSIYIFQVLHKGWDKDFWGIIIFIKLEYYIYTVCYTFCLTSFKASYAIFSQLPCVSTHGLCTAEYFTCFLFTWFSGNLCVCFGPVTQYTPNLQLI